MVEEILLEMGLIKVEDISDLHRSVKCIASSMSQHEQRVRFFPLTRKASLNKSRLFNLYGTHWLYETKLTPTPQELVKIDGDANLILDELRRDGEISPRHPIYAFHQKGIMQYGGLWLFKQGTVGWDYLMGEIMPRFQEDLNQYNAKRQEILDSRKPF